MQLLTYIEQRITICRHSLVLNDKHKRNSKNVILIYYVFKKMWIQLTVAVITNKSFFGMQNANEKEKWRGQQKNVILGPSLFN
jgi:hypothetical protein